MTQNNPNPEKPICGRCNGRKRRGDPELIKDAYMSSPSGKECRCDVK